MADSSTLPAEFPKNRGEDALEKDLENIIEAIENMSVQLTWMAYDMVALRTSPELGSSVRKLEEVCHRCTAVVCGDREQEPDVAM